MQIFLFALLFAFAVASSMVPTAQAQNPINREITSNVADVRSSGFDLYIHRLNVKPPNFLDGVNVAVAFALLDTTKVGKYLRLRMVPYNSVGDRVQCEIRNRSEAEVTIVGPLSAVFTPTILDLSAVTFESVWYNSVLACVEIVRAEIEYTDGSRSIYVNDLPAVLSSQSSNDCSL